MRAPSPAFFCSASASLSCSAVIGARLHETLAERQVLRHREGVVDEAVAEEDLAPLLPTADRERPRLGAHLHQLEDVGETELLQVALEKHCSPRSAAGPRPSTAVRLLHRQRRANLKTTTRAAARAGRGRRGRRRSTSARPRTRASPAAGPSGRHTGASQAPARSRRRRSAPVGADGRGQRRRRRRPRPPQRTPEAAHQEAGERPADGRAAEEHDRPQGHDAAAHGVVGVELQQRVGGADEEHAGGADRHEQHEARRRSRARPRAAA